MRKRLACVFVLVRSYTADNGASGLGGSPSGQYFRSHNGTELPATNTPHPVGLPGNPGEPFTRQQDKFFSY